MGDGLVNGHIWSDRSVGDGVIELFGSVLGVDGDSRCRQVWEEFERAAKMSCCIGSSSLVNPFRFANEFVDHRCV